MIIDDFSQPPPLASIGTRWQLFTDQVMGGVSHGNLSHETVAGRSAIRMRGDVSLANNGGFVQISLDLAPAGGSIEAGGFDGIEIDVLGPREEYSLHLRTADTVRPWQSYLQSFRAFESWQRLQLPFGTFVGHRIDVPLDLTKLRRIGLVAIGRAFTADLSLSRIAFYRS